MIVNHGYFIRESETGYFKKYFMSLVNSELHVFSHKESETHIEMHILQGCFVTKIDEPIKKPKYWKGTKEKEFLYPVEIYLGGKFKVQTLLFEE